MMAQPVRTRESHHLVLDGRPAAAEAASGTGESLHRLAGREDDHGLRLLIRLVADGVLEPGADRDDGAGTCDRASDGAVPALDVDGELTAQCP